MLTIRTIKIIQKQSQLHPTLLSDGKINDKFRSLTIKGKYLISYIIGISNMSKLSQGILQSNQHRLIRFS